MTTTALAKTKMQNQIIRTEIIKQLQKQKNPERAIQQQRYMKSSMPYAGLTADELRKLAKAVFDATTLDTSEDWQATILTLWHEAEVREERYAALQLLAVRRYNKKWLNPSIMPMLRELVESGAWWDYVDNFSL